MKTAKFILLLVTIFVSASISGFAASLVSPPDIITQPVTQAVPLGQQALFSVGVTGELPLRYQWYSVTDGGSTTNKLSGRTSPVLNLGNMSEKLVAGYYVVVTSPIFVPVSVTSIVANLTVATSTLTVCIDGRCYGTTAPAGSQTLGSATNGAVLDVGRTYSIQAIPGHNDVLVGWEQSFGDTPSIISSTTAKEVQLGRELLLNFTMESNLILTATFETNPLIEYDAVASYSGLFFQGDGYPCMQDSTGFVNNWMVKSNGNYRGAIRIGGESYTITGTLDLDGNDEEIVSRASHGLPNLFFNLHLESRPEKTVTANSNEGISINYDNEFEGCVSNMVADGWVASLYADENAESPCAYPQYTMLIPPAKSAPYCSPGGFGYASITNNNRTNGIVTIAGKLADGTPFSQSVAMDYFTDVPIYIELNNHQGLLAGWLELNDDADDFGWLTWFKPGGLSTPITYPEGFTNQVTVFGSPYCPETGDPAICIPEGMASIEDVCAFGTPFRFPISINNDDQIVKTYGGPTNAFAGTINFKNGLFTASFRPTGMRTNVTCYGAVLQNATEGVIAELAIKNTTTLLEDVLPGAGYFLGQTNTGIILLEGGLEPTPTP